MPIGSQSCLSFMPIGAKSILVLFKLLYEGLSREKQQINQFFVLDL